MGASTGSLKIPFDSIWQNRKCRGKPYFTVTAVMMWLFS